MFYYNRKTISFAILTLFLTIGFLFFLSSSPTFAEPLKLQIHIDKLAEISQDQINKGLGITVYLTAIYRWFVGALSMLAVLFIMIGGLIWLTAAGNTQRVTQAKKLIFDSLFGLAIVLGSWLLLSTINPDLVNFSELAVTKIDTIAFEGRADRSIEEPPDTGTPGPSGKPGRPGKKGKKSEYNAMACPTRATPTFSAFFTKYYKPPYGNAGKYKSFLCNVGMQCSCPGSKTKKDEGRDFTQSCGPNFKPPLHPCKDFSQGTPYCTSGANGKSPIPHVTIAASRCFRFGCKITLDNGQVLIVGDRGGDIKGRHFDYYVGTDITGPAPSQVHTVTADPATCY